MKSANERFALMPDVKKIIASLMANDVGEIYFNDPAAKEPPKNKFPESR